MSKITKTLPRLVQDAHKAVGNGNIIHHDSMNNNQLGQSGLHTLVDDIVTIVLSSKDEADAVKRLERFFLLGSL